MSCCPPAPEINIAEVNLDEPTQGAEVERHPGETEDCYMRRRGNVSETGQVDDKTEPVECKININSIVPDGTASINITFGMTTGGCGVTSWEFTPASFPGVTMNTSTGAMSGTFDSSVHGQRLTLRVKAYAGATLLDDRTYAFSPTIYDSTNSIQLTHPLPGSRVTSQFGPRKPPAQGASSQHGGCDFATGRRAEVLCAADGVVDHADPGRGYGNYIIVKHLDAAGQHLISTLYAHLDEMYVKRGQKVKGGQPLGREGNTGIGSGPHLHFEVRTRNGTKVDPLPYIRGPIPVSVGVTPDNQPTGGVTLPPYPPSNNRGATDAGVQAAEGCEAFGPNYPDPATPQASAPTPPAVTPTNGGGLPPPELTDAFERAWYFTMTHEVNSKWMTTADTTPINAPPNDVWNGTIDTAEQRKRVGFVDHPKDPGGVTKFGVAQRYNPKVDVREVDYPTSRQTGYNVYWLAPSNNCSVMSPRIACMAFDMNYLMGPGGSKKVMQQAGVSGTETGAAELAALEAITAARISYLRAKPGWPTFGKGWTRRAMESLAYCKELT